MRAGVLRLIDRAMVTGGVLGTLFWIVFSVMSHKLFPLVVYYPLWLGVIGTLVWRSRTGLSARLRAWRVPAWAKILILGFGAVLSEEVFAALANHLTEGFSPHLYLVRIGQFWALNVCAFFGFVIGWCLLIRTLRFSRREVFYLAGLWGLFAEKIIVSLVAAPLFFVFTAPPTILTYGLIITPALLSQELGGGRRLHAALRYPLAYAVLFVVSVPGILVLSVLRAHFPDMFPPVSMVAQ